MSQYFSWVSPDHAGLWRLDNDATDSGPNALDGAASSISYTIGKFGKSASFTGASGSKIQIATACPVAMAVTTLTAKLWYRGADTASRAFLFGFDGVYIAYSGSSDTYCGYCLQLASGAVQFRLANNCVAANIDYLTGPSVADSAWHWLVATRDDNYARLYVDGAVVDEDSSPEAPGWGSGAYYRFTGMGAAYVPGYTPLSLGYYPTCQMDEIELLNRAMTEKEVWQEYTFLMGGA